MIQCYEIFPSCQNGMGTSKTVCQYESVIILRERECVCKYVAIKQTKQILRTIGKWWECSKKKTNKVIYLQQKQTNNNIKLGRKQNETQTKFIHSYLASEKERDDERRARQEEDVWDVNIFCFVFSAPKVIGRKCVFSYVDVLSLPTNSENKNIQIKK